MPVYLPRPVSCDEKPSPVLQALPPAAEKPPAQVLLDELAGPVAAPAAPETATNYLTGTPDEGGGSFFPGGGGFPGGVGVPGGGGGQPPVGPPGGGQPPITPPDGGPPPILPPDGGQPPIILPPDGGPPPVLPPDGGPPPVTPPDGPPPITPPEGPPPIIPPITPPGGPPPGVPEPATWAMLIFGFFGLGSALRRQKRAATLK